MLILASTSDKLQLTSGSASTLDVHVSYASRTEATGAVTNANTNTAITTATTTDILASPASGLVRNAKLISVRNKDASVSNAVTLKHVNGSATVEIVKATLLVGEELVLNDAGTILIFDANGNVKATPGTGRLLRSTLLVAGSSFTTGLDCSAIRVKLQAAGGGGGGCTSVAAAASAAGGGSAGGYAEKFASVTPGTAISYALGAAGAGASGAGGTTATDSTVTINGTVITAKGGVGAVVATALTTVSAYAGAASPAVGTNGDINLTGQPGAPGLCILVATPIVASGAGGDAVLGAGAVGLAAVGAGNSAAALGYGGGGGGAATGASTVRTGGNAAPACLVVEEYS